MLPYINMILRKKKITLLIRMLIVLIRKLEIREGVVVGNIIWQIIIVGCWLFVDEDRVYKPCWT